MGIFNASALPAIQPPVGVYPSMCASTSTSVGLQEGVLNHNGDLTIKDSAGAVVLHCKRPDPSRRILKVLVDPNGQELFAIRTAHTAVNKAYIGEDSDGQEAFRIEQRYRIGPMLQAGFHDESTNTTQTVSLKGDFWEGSADLVLAQGQEVARLRSKPFSPRQMFGAKRSYTVTIAVGVDVALMTAVIMCFEDATNDINGRGGLQIGVNVFNGQNNP